MTKLEIPPDQAALHTLLDAMDEGELLAEQLSHHGAIQALEYVLATGCSPQLVEQLLARVRVNMQCAAEMSERKGMRRLIDGHIGGYH